MSSKARNAILSCLLICALLTIAHLSSFALFAEYQYRLYLPLIVRQYP